MMWLKRLLRNWVNEATDAALCVEQTNRPKELSMDGPFSLIVIRKIANGTMVELRLEDRNSPVCTVPTYRFVPPDESVMDAIKVSMVEARLS